MNESVQTELKKIFNGRFSTSESTRANYADEKILMSQYYLKQ